MEMKRSIILFWTTLMYVTTTAQSLQLKTYGLYNKTEQVKVVESNVGLHLGGFDPQYGYQGGIVYTQPVYKSFVILGEMGYLKDTIQLIRVLSSLA
jgi:hypothetical protein